MNRRSLGCALLVCVSGSVAIGCNGIRDLPAAPGNPKFRAETVRPDQVTDFATLYGQNCAACHGAEGRNGAAISLANPVYLAIAGEQNIERVTSLGVRGTLMPAFAKSAGGMLTDRQIGIISQGMFKLWSSTATIDATKLPPYKNSLKANVGNGQKAFAVYCRRCHAMDSTVNGAIGSGKLQPASQSGGSLVDPAYLALISDQGLRSIVIAGQPEEGMPDWRSDSTEAPPLSDQQITDIVSWLGTFRTSTPGQIYQNHQ